MARRFVARAEGVSSALTRDVEALVELVCRRPGLTETDLREALAMPRRRFKNALVGAIAEEDIERRWATGGSLARGAGRYFSPAAEGSNTAQWSGEELKGRRDRAGLSKAALARKVGVTPGAIATWERGGAPLGRADQLVAIFDTPPTGQDILDAVEHAGWSQSEFARRVGVSRATARAWLHGAPIPGSRCDTVRQAIREARNVDAAEVPSPREALLALLEDQPGGVRRTELKGWRSRYRLGREVAAQVIDAGITKGQAHWEQDFIDVADHKRVVWRLVCGRIPEAAEAPRLPGSELRRLRDDAELTRREAADLLAVGYSTYVNWENDAPVPPARVTGTRYALKEAAKGRTPIDERSREIVRVVSRHPDISRTKLFERHVGDSQLSRRALERALGDERLHERLVELVGRQPARGLRVGPPPEPADVGSALTGATLKARRGTALLQRELAQAIGASTAAISRWEKHGERIPSRFRQLIEDVLADTERRLPKRAAERAQAAADRALSSVVEGISRRPGMSKQALLDRLSRPGVREALGQALEAGQVHEERRTVFDSAGRPHVRIGFHLGRGSEVGPPPDPIDPSEIRSVRRGAGLSQSELGQLVGVTQATVTGWERTKPVPVGRREALREILAKLRVEQTKSAGSRRLPRADVPSVAQLVAEQPGITPSRLLVRVNAKRRRRLAQELAEAIACRDVHERRTVLGGRERVELHPGSTDRV